MIRTQIYLTEQEREVLSALSLATGRAQSEIIREALDQFILQGNPARRKAILARAAGMWKDRQDLPDFAAMRN